MKNHRQQAKRTGEEQHAVCPANEQSVQLVQYQRFIDPEKSKLQSRDRQQI
uniref:Uncharacterized protein n=1 Tax=Rhizophora mucronata TaxID=61149 RepID=A0A2P2PKL7_RHIMU